MSWRFVPEEFADEAAQAVLKALHDQGYILLHPDLHRDRMARALKDVFAVTDVADWKPSIIADAIFEELRHD